MLEIFPPTLMKHCSFFSRPSPLFLVFTVLLNAIPGVVFIVLGLLNIHNHCDTYVPAFFYVTAAINLFFVGFAIHIYTYFSRPYDARVDSDTGPMARWVPQRQPQEGDA